MKRFNYDKIVFWGVSLLIAVGLFSRELLVDVCYAGYKFFRNPNIYTLVDRLDEASKNINFKSSLIDLQSLVYRLTGTRKVIKDDDNVLLLENEYLCFYMESPSDELIDKAVNACVELKKETDVLNIPLMYVYVPRKSYFEEKFHDEYRRDCDEFLQLLNDGGIHVLQLAEKMKEQGMSMEEAYFVTDHHWSIETGFWAFTEICKELKRKYDFRYDPDLTSLSNYNVEIYEDWFLGSQGKKVGRFYSPLGTDDFALITPKFETNLSVEDVTKNNTGVFEDTVLSLNNLNEKNYYLKNCYITYTGGDFPVQTIENNLFPDSAEKILVIRDSFASSVTPFLALTTSSVHTLDIRSDMNWGDQRVESVSDYIKNYNPDYVVILYSGLEMYEDNFSKYDFR